jgi:hypothetical protein
MFKNPNPYTGQIFHPAIKSVRHKQNLQAMIFTASQNILNKISNRTSHFKNKHEHKLHISINIVLKVAYFFWLACA